MKAVLSLVLVFVMILCMCACSDSGADSDSKPALKVGYGRVDITPSESIPLGGYGNADTRLSTGYLDSLYLTCIAFTDSNDNTILLFSQDLLGANSKWTKPARQAISAATGIPADHIAFSGSHTHSAPDSTAEHPATQAFTNNYPQYALQAAQAALKDQAEATLYYGSTIVEGMNFIRHYVLENGTYAGSNFGDFNSAPIKDHAESNDPEMQILKIDRVNEAKKDILVMNWQAHPCFTDGNGSGTNLSADFIGAARDYVESETGCHFSYFTAAAGNHNAVSKIKSEMHNLTYQEYGAKLGQAMIDALDTLTKAKDGPVKSTQLIYEAPRNQADVDKLAEAQEVMEVYKTRGSNAAYVRARELGLSSRFHASSIISRAGNLTPVSLELNAFSIGSCSFIFAPFEMFAATGRDIKENTPFDQTIICTCATNSLGYMPSNSAYEYGCYESHTSRYEQGTAEKVRDTYLDMLKGLQAE